jgi:hypothetical protein
MRALRCALWAAWHVLWFRLRGRPAVSSWLGKPEEDETPAEVPHYFRIEVSPYMLTRLKSVMAKQAADQTNKALNEAIELAERVNLPYTPPVDWDALERKAREGYSIADQIFDGLVRKKPETKGETE